LNCNYLKKQKEISSENPASALFIFAGGFVNGLKFRKKRFWSRLKKQKKEEREKT
jgi:hypothetical protein